jgi:hypothetical protein
MALTITDEIMRSDQTAHTARLGHFEAGDAWRVSWLPHRLMDRNAAITAMTLADLASQGEGISSHDDPRWPTVEALAAELGLSGPDAVVRISEPGPGTAPRADAAGIAGAVLCAHAEQDGRGAHWLAPDEKCEAVGVDGVSRASDVVRKPRRWRGTSRPLLHLRRAERLAELPNGKEQAHHDSDSAPGASGTG